MGELAIHALDEGRRDDFLKLHSACNGHGWCRCVAWWVAGWQGWGERTEAENLALRTEVFERGDWDGYLLYQGSEPIAWCQVGPRDLFPGLVHDFERAPDPGVHAVGCFFVAPGHRGQGHARRLLAAVLEDLVRSGVSRVEAFPRADLPAPGARADGGEIWCGPRTLFEELGFAVLEERGRRLVMGLDLAQESAG